MTATPAPCTVCGATDTVAVVDIPAVPVYCNVLWPDAAQARDAARGDMALCYCRECGHFFNRAFDPGLTEYTTSYENSLHYSPVFNDYAQTLAERLVRTYGLRGKDVIEIGCGKGDFLRMLCAAGGNRGLGFDSSFDHGREDAGRADDVRFVQGFYDADAAHHPVDFMVSRHVLEHIETPTAFLSGLRRLIGERTGTVLYFEVPNALYTIDRLGIWDLIYEHCSYFTRQSLARCFELAGFELLDIGEAFDAQFLYVEARPAPAAVTTCPMPPLAPITARVGEFRDLYNAKVGEWRERLQRMQNDSERAVVWGAGSKGVTFLNTVAVPGAVEAVVDLNPHKHGRFVPGEAQRVIAPSDLAGITPDTVIIMNPVYRDEIRSDLESMGLAPEVLCV